MINTKILLRIVIILFCLLLGGGLSFIKQTTVVETSAIKHFSKPIYRVDTNEKKISISFDAAWGADKTETILEILEERNIRTTFFLVGFWIEDFPDMVERITSGHHEIGNHSDSHYHMTELSKGEIEAELLGVEKKLYPLVKDCRCNLFRPPFGEYDENIIETACDNGYYTIQWTIDSLDWKAKSSEEIISRVISQLQPGAIILFHNNGEHTVEALPSILDQIMDMGYEIVPISELIFQQDYLIDVNGVQHKLTD